MAPGLHRRGTLEHWLIDLGWQCLKDPVGALAVPVRAGGIVVFSSLTPHRTGPNRTDAVRKAYIVLFTAEGAYRMEPEREGSGYRCVPCDAPDRQFPILAGGAGV